LTITTFLAAIFALATLSVGMLSIEALFVLTFLFGGMTLPIYSLCIAHTNDHLEPAQMVAASGTLVLVGGIGASFGPSLGAVLMSLVGPEGFFLSLGAVHSGIGFFALYRMSKRAATPLDEQGPAVPVVSGAVPAGGGALSAAALRDQMDSDLAQMSRMQRRRF
jgi:MFS family permease